MDLFRPAMPNRNRRPISFFSFFSHKNRQLEQRHADQLRLVQEVAQAERDQLVSQLQRELDQRLQQLQLAKEEESRLKGQLTAMSEVRHIIPRHVVQLIKVNLLSSG